MSPNRIAVFQHSSLVQHYSFVVLLSTVLISFLSPTIASIQVLVDLLSFASESCYCYYDWIGCPNKGLKLFHKETSTWKPENPSVPGRPPFIHEPRRRWAPHRTTMRRRRADSQEGIAFCTRPIPLWSFGASLHARSLPGWACCSRYSFACRSYFL